MKLPWPHSPADRLVYADFIEIENGEIERAEMIRLEVRLGDHLARKQRRHPTLHQATRRLRELLGRVCWQSNVQLVRLGVFLYSFNQMPQAEALRHLLTLVDPVVPYYAELELLTQEHVPETLDNGGPLHVHLCPYQHGTGHWAVAGSSTWTIAGASACWQEAVLRGLAALARPRWASTVSLDLSKTIQPGSVSPAPFSWSEAKADEPFDLEEL